VTNELTVNIASRCLLDEEIRVSLETDFAPLYHDPPDHGSWVTGPRPPCRVRYRRRPIPLSGGL
jgi:hypothetical protein